MLEWIFGSLQNESYGGKIQDGFIENTAEQGNGKRIELFTDVDDIIEGYFYIADISIFYDFYRLDTVNGTIPFEFYDGLNDITRIASFIGNPMVSKEGQYYKVTVALLLEHLPVENKAPILSTGRILQNGAIRITEDEQERITE